jgi:small conductance mechanosensitive channel
LNELRNLGELVGTYGVKLMLGLIIFILGIALSKWVTRAIKAQLAKVIKKKSTLSMISNGIGIILMGVFISASSVAAGAKADRVVALLMIICLVAIGIVVIFRPLIPELPFKVGHIVKIGSLLGRIEATTILNTRLKTFDGKTFFVPNRKILDDIVINYYYTETRQVKVNLIIGYDQDLLRAKQIVESVMIGDPRILEKPSPQVYVLNFGPYGIEIGPRCWVENTKYWQTKCDLIEKIKYRFDREGIVFPYPQFDVHHYTKDRSPGSIAIYNKTDELESKGT